MPTRRLLTLRELAADDAMVLHSARGKSGITGFERLLPFGVKSSSVQLPTSGPYSWVALDDGTYLVVAAGRRWVAE